MNETKKDTQVKTKFDGYKAKLIDGTIVWVINRNDSARMKATGEVAPALKIRERRLVGYQGWSGGARPAYAYGAAYWIRASKVV